MHTCQLCGAPATVHLTDIINKKKRESHLCEQCARDQNIIPTNNEPQLNIAGLIQALMQQAFGSLASTPTSGDPTDEKPDPNTIVCPECGLKYAQFRADGRLGCPTDYDIYQAVLTPLLERVHRRLSHAGKAPSSVRREREVESQRLELEDLRRLLADAVATENYEEAARIRDRLRQKEAAG